MRIRKKLYKNQSNSGLDFISRCLTKIESDTSLVFKDLYEHYKLFCQNEGHKNPASKPEFRKILEAEAIKVKNSSKHANQVRVFGVNYTGVM